MSKRYVSIWFRHIATDWYTIREPFLRNKPVVVCKAVNGRMVIVSSNALAEQQGIFPGMVLADARALVPGLETRDDQPEQIHQLLHRIAEWCIRFTPSAAVDEQDGLLLDASGCTHLWGGDPYYITAIAQRFKRRGYDVRIAMADTIAAAWGVARYGEQSLLIEKDKHHQALLSLPPAALKLPAEILELLSRLGLNQIGKLVTIPRSALFRRFGPFLVQRLNQALGTEEEMISPVQETAVYSERLPCPEPVHTATAIAIALEHLLQLLCNRLKEEEKGLRNAVLKAYRIDGKIVQVQIGTNRASSAQQHLFKLLEQKIPEMDPGPGIELFVLEAPVVEDNPSVQEKLWGDSCDLDDMALSELLDRVTCKMKAGIHRYLPDEHYWPERSLRPALSLEEKTELTWSATKQRPTQLLQVPEKIEVTAPIPDYPPMLFRYRSVLHKIVKADGPERIEQEWWLQEGKHRDYYTVEDEKGQRYWLFRAGHYDKPGLVQWFLHGFFS